MIATIDASVTRRVLVVASVASDVHHLQFVARGTERDAIAAALEREGFLRGSGAGPLSSERWVRFIGCGVHLVELHTVDGWGVPSSELASLFDEAGVIDRARNVAWPARHHVLLVTALRLARGDAGPEEKIARHPGGVMADEAEAWRLAVQRAPLWGLQPDLSLAPAADNGPTAVRRVLEKMRQDLSSSRAAEAHTSAGVARRLPLTRSSAIIAFSGLDGSGKSSQVRALQAALVTLGFETVVEWMPLGHNPSVRFLRRSTKDILTFAARAAGPEPPRQIARGRSLIAGPEPAWLSRQSTVITHVWSTVVGVASAMRYRWTALRHVGKGRIVIYDRYALDSFAQLRYFYGETRDFRFQRWLVRTICPTPRCAYFLDVPPETALRRKREQYNIDQLRRQATLLREEAARFGVRRLDGERSREDLCEEITSEVWRALSERRPPDGEPNSNVKAVSDPSVRAAGAPHRRVPPLALRTARSPR